MRIAKGIVRATSARVGVKAKPSQARDTGNALPNTGPPKNHEVVAKLIASKRVRQALDSRSPATKKADISNANNSLKIADAPDRLAWQADIGSEPMLGRNLYKANER